jgi:hypothetical protein
MNPLGNSSKKLSSSSPHPSSPNVSKGNLEIPKAKLIFKDSNQSLGEKLSIDFSKIKISKADVKKASFIIGMALLCLSIIGIPAFIAIMYKQNQHNQYKENVLGQFDTNSSLPELE